MISNFYNQSFQKYTYQQKFSCQQKNKPQIGFRGLNEEQPNNFKEIIPNLLYIGGIIETPQQLNFLCNRKFNSILNLINPETEESPYGEARYSMRKERELIKENNADETRRFIEHKTSPVWSDLWIVCSNEMYPNPNRNAEDVQWVDSKREDVKNKLITTINELKPPVYMHCITGTLLSPHAVELIKEAEREGKLNIGKQIKTDSKPPSRLL